MATIVTRAGKGSPLTNAEVDANFTNLNSQFGSYLPLAGGTVTGLLSITTASLATPLEVIRNSTQNVGGKFANTNYTTFFGLGNANGELRVGTVADLQGSGNIVLHAANVGSYAPSLTGSGASGTWGIAVTGNAGTATTLQTGRTIGMTGDVSWTSSSFNGSANVTGTATLANSGVTAGTYTKVTVDAKGRVTTGASLASGDLPTYTGTITSSQITTGLGFTPYNSANPSGYITSSALSSYLPLSGGTLSGVLRINSQLQVGQNTNGTAYIDAYNGYAWFGRDSNTAGVRVDGSGNVHTTAALNSVGALTQNGNQVLHAGNYTSYSPSLTGSGASGTWGINVTGSAGSVAWGNVSSRPSNIMYYQGFTLDANAMDSNATGFTYSNNAPYTGPIARFSAGGGYDLWLTAPYNGGGNGLAFRTRNGDSASFNPWRQVLHDGNYTSYSPSLTGSGASGTWGINVTGNAATATSVTGVAGVLGYSVSAQNTAYAGSGGPQVTGQGGGGAILSFHRPGAYGLNMGLDSDNVFRIGGWSASANRLQMDMSGNLTMNGNVTAYSDERLKRNWSALPTDFVEQLALVKHGVYERIGEELRQVGVGAQSLQRLMPEAVLIGQDEQKTLSVAYGNAALASAIQLAIRVVQQDKRIAALEAIVIGDN